MIDDGQLVAQFLRFFELVGGEQDRLAAVAEVPDVAPDRRAGMHVDPERGLIQDDDLGVVQQRAGNRQPPFHAAGEGLHPGVRAVGQADQPQQPRDAVRLLAGRDPVQVSVKGHVGLRRELVVQRGFLGHGAQQLPDLAPGAPGFHLHPEDRDRPRCRRDETADHVDRGGLARPVGPEQPEHLAAGYVEVELAHRGEQLLAPAELPGDIVECDGRRRGGRRRRARLVELDRGCPQGGHCGLPRVASCTVIPPTRPRPRSPRAWLPGWGLCPGRS